VKGRLARAGKLLLPWLLAAGLLAGNAAAAGASRVPINGPPRVVMILVDIHISEASAIQNEELAVQNYETALPSDVRTGLIVFSDNAHLAVFPTTNRQQVPTQLAETPPAGATSIGVRSAIREANAQVDRLHAADRGMIVIFSDGEGLHGALPAPAAKVGVVTWHIGPGDNPGVLITYAHQNGGLAVSPTGVATLAAQFKPLSAGSPGSGGTSTYNPAPTLSPAGQGHSSPAGARTPWLLVIGIATIFALFFVLALVLIHLAATRIAGRDLIGQLERYGPRRTTPVRDDEDHGKVASTALDLVGRAIGTGSTQQRLAQRLDLANISRKPAEWVLFGICGSAVVAAALSLATRYVLIGIVGGALVGWATMRLTLSLRIARRRAVFSDQLPDLLQLVAGSLQSGFSLPQALDSVVREDTQPAAGEFARALAEARIGADLTDSLDTVATRMDSDDLHWTVMAIRIQRGVGGNLGEVLLTIASTIRERAYLRRQVRALSAEGRLSGYVLVALPILVGGWLFITSSRYMRPLYTTPIGLLMLLGAIGLVVVGAMWMRTLVKVEV
jgi:tight adherence protein B